MSQVFKQFLMIPLSILWGGILAMRLLLAREALGNFLGAAWFNCAFFLFVLAVAVCEISILFRAQRAYKVSAEPTVSTYDRLAGAKSPKATGTMKLLLVIFAFCLPFGLWDSRYMAVRSALPGLMAGGAFNLFFTALLANAMFSTKNKTRPLQIT